MWMQIILLLQKKFKKIVVYLNKHREDNLQRKKSNIIIYLKGQSQKITMKDYFQKEDVPKNHSLKSLVF